MMTREQLQAFASANGVPLFTQERDYAQALFLFRLYKRGAPLIFKGGTCLKLTRDSPRFSEDLDFTATRELVEVKSALKAAADELNMVGMEAKINQGRARTGGYQCRLKYHGPLYTGEERTAGGVAIDVSFRRDVILRPEWRTIPSPYPDTPPFTAQCMQAQEILTEKVRALSIRAAPRDLYDVWFLLNRGIKPSLRMIDRKLSLHKKRFSIKKFSDSIGRVKLGWKRDLAPLLSSAPRFETVSREVIARLEPIAGRYRA